MYNIIQLNDKELSELQSIAKELGIKNAESMKKDELVYGILDEQAIAGASKKAAKDAAKEAQPRKRSRISVKKEGDKVYTATQDKAQKLEANTPEVPKTSPFNDDFQPKNEEATETPSVEPAKAEGAKPAQKKRGRKPKNEKVEEVLDYAYATIGVPYVYGAVRLHDGKGNFLKGFTAQNFDCSSLVQYAFYYGADELLDVTTRTQFVQGEKIKKSELSRGDCMYFTNDERRNRTGIERVGHVAIYLGNDYILHTASDYARIEKMTAKRWNYYIEARRFT
jgi:cell wall-associated NlpC family hydrolase